MSRKLGILPKEKIYEIQKLRQSGLSYHKIAKFVGCSPQTAWEKCNPEKVYTDTEYNSKYSKENREKERLRLRDFHRKNPEYNAAALSKRRFAKIKGSVLIQSEDEKQKIRDIYKKAAKLTKETGTPHHVDHIEPLCGKNSCGLHVSYNLQILTAEQNLKKNNKEMRI